MDRPLRGKNGVSDAVDPRAARLRGDVRLAEVRFLSHPDPFHQLPRRLVCENCPREHAAVAADSECEGDQSSDGFGRVAAAAVLDAESPSDLALSLAVADEREKADRLAVGLALDGEVDALLRREDL